MSFAAPTDANVTSPDALAPWLPAFGRFALLLTVAGLGLAVGAQRFIYADGGNFFLQNLAQHHISDWDPWRQFAHYITQGPMALALAAGVRSVPMLATLNGAGLFFFPLLLLWPCIYVVPAMQPGIVALCAGIFLHVQINASFFIISEAHVALSLLLFVTLYIFYFDVGPQARRPMSGIDVYACVAATLATRVYETMALFAAVLLTLGIVRWRAAGAGGVSPSRRAALCYVCVAQAAAGALGLYAMLFNSGRTVGEVGIGTTIGKLLADPTAWASSLVLGTAFIAAIAPPLHRGQPRRPAVIFCAMLGGALGALPLLSDRFVPATLHYPARLFTIVWPLLLLVVLFARERHARVPLNALLTMALATLTGWNASWYATTSYRWLQYRSEVLAIVHDGPIMQPLSATSLSHSPFTFTWAMPSQSIVEQALVQQPARAVILPDTPGRWAPFAAEQPERWPDLSAYGLPPVYPARH